MCYKLKIVDTFHEISCYEHEWINLESLDSECTIFQSYDWTKNYCNFLLANKKAFIILFYQENLLVSIFPMQVRSFRGIMLYEFMGSCGVDFLMPLTMDIHKENIYAEFSSWLESQNDNTIFVFEDIPRLHSFSQYLRSCNSQKILSEYYDLCSYYIIWLPDTWNEYKDSLSNRMRHDIEYDRRYISKNIEIEFQELNINRIDEHILLNKSRMHSRQLKSPFDFESSCLFWKKYLNDEFLKNRLKFYAVTSGSDIVASILSVDVKQKRYILNLNINMQYAKLSPGNVLLGHLVEESINQGFKALDFGRGKDQYKLRLGAKEYLNDRCIICTNAEKQKLYNSYVFYLYNKIGYYLSDA